MIEVKGLLFDMFHLNKNRNIIVNKQVLRDFRLMDAKVKIGKGVLICLNKKKIDYEE